MKAKTEKKAKVTLKNRQPWERLDEKIKEKIVEEMCKVEFSGFECIWYKG